MKHRFSSYIITSLIDVWNIFVGELRRVFKDPGVMILFFLAGLAYPFIYNLMYYKNVIQEVPVAVVDMCGSQQSRDFIRKWDATPEVQVVYACTTMEEAEHLLRAQKVHGILYIPVDYSAALASGLDAAKISLYADMSSFLYMKNVYLSANMVAVNEMNRIQVERYEAMNMGEQMSWALVQGVQYDDVSIFNPTAGYGSFLVPAVLVLILHQTLLFGICMLCGTAREENSEVFLLPGKKRRYSVLRIITGRSAAYFVIYMAIGAFDLLVVPRIFHLPHLANPWDIVRMLAPFLLGTIYLAMAIGSFLKEREMGMVTLLFTSLILIFLSGVSWPFEAMPRFWQIVAKCLPSTWGVNTYVRLNTMGANISTLIDDYNKMWLIAGAYFLICVLIYLVRSRLHERQAVKMERIANLRRMARARQRAEQVKQRAEEVKQRVEQQVEQVENVTKRRISSHRKRKNESQS